MGTDNLWMVSETIKLASAQLREAPVPTEATELAAEGEKLVRLRMRVFDLQAQLRDRGNKLAAGLNGLLERDQGVDVTGGRIVRRRRKVGKAFVNKEEVDKHAGELPEDARPETTTFITIPKDELPTLVAAQILGMGEEERKEKRISVKDEVKYPTVKQLREHGFGESCVGERREEGLFLEEPYTDEDGKGQIAQVPLVDAD